MASDRKGQGLHNRYLKIISGSHKGVAGNIGRSLLCFLEFLYKGVTEIRNWLFDKGYLKAEKLPIPVISVGNLTAGGTGKTPVVFYLVQWLNQLEKKPAIITRGYKAEANLAESHLVANSQGFLLNEKEAGDEATQLAKSLTGTPVWIGADRVQSGWRAIRESEAEILILDDGFQHRRLMRDIDIVLIDALRPWGYDHVLPRGLLREDKKNLKRADLVLLTRSDLVDQEVLSKIEAEVRTISPEIPIFETTHEAKSLKDLQGNLIDFIPQNTEKKAYLFCGLGNPQGFFETAKQAGFILVGKMEFPDHYSYDLTDLAFLEKEAKELGAKVLVTTEKDGVKLQSFGFTEIPIWQLGIELSVKNREDELKNVIMKKNNFN